MLIARYDIDVVVDVGANFGQFRDTLRNEVGFEGPIVSFEPVTKFRTKLEARRHSDPSWYVEPYALGSARGKAVIHVMASPGLSSIKEPVFGAMRSLLPAPDKVRVDEDESIEVRPLDEIAASHPALRCARRALLKIDTQGFDVEVIRGAREFLKQTAAIQIELSVLPIYADTPSYQDVIAELHALGLDLSGMFPVTLDAQLRVIEFDGVFVRRAAPVHGDQAPLTIPGAAPATTA